MTSKEALKLLYSDAENYAYFNETKEDLSEIKAEYELIKQDLERLEELEQKATPKKVKNKTRIKGVCPYCNGNVSIDENYCPRCGQRLEWL